MTLKELKKIISQGEGEQLEFKSSFGKDVIETLSAFANNAGGIVIIGINDRGSIIGTSVENETIQQYINQIKISTEPSLMVDASVVEISEKTILLIKVDEFPIKPVGFKGRYFRRISNSNHRMNLTEISNLHIQSLQLSWDAYESPGMSFSDLDKNKINRFIERVNKSGRFVLNGTPEENLQKLALAKSGRVSNAAKLLFACDQTDYNIHIGRFKTPSMILDDKIIKGTLFEAVEQTMAFILYHIKVAFEFTGEVERNEIFEYPNLDKPEPKKVDQIT